MFLNAFTFIVGEYICQKRSLGSFLFPINDVYNLFTSVKGFQTINVYGLWCSLCNFLTL